jgi:Flp pilus assembly secretin CpaC
MKRWQTLFICIGCVAISACASNEKLENVPLVWKPTLALGTSSAFDVMHLSQKSLTVLPLQDQRSNRRLIGENREENAPRPITTSDDVAAFMTQHIRDLLAQAGCNIVDTNGQLELEGEVTSFFVPETGTYVGDVRIRATLRTSGNKVLWQGIVGGTAEHFGRSYRAENYYETLSDSLVHLVENLLRDPSFQTALAH